MMTSGLPALEANVMVRNIVQDDGMQPASAKQLLSRCMAGGQMLPVPLTIVLKLWRLLRSSVGLGRTTCHGSYLGSSWRPSWPSGLLRTGHWLAVVPQEICGDRLNLTALTSRWPSTASSHGGPSTKAPASSAALNCGPKRHSAFRCSQFSPLVSAGRSTKTGRRRCHVGREHGLTASMSRRGNSQRRLAAQARPSDSIWDTTLAKGFQQEGQPGSIRRADVAAGDYSSA